jgi:hypothetical protein
MVGSVYVSARAGGVENYRTVDYEIVVFTPDSRGAPSDVIDRIVIAYRNVAVHGGPCRGSVYEKSRSDV